MSLGKEQMISKKWVYETDPAGEPLGSQGREGCFEIDPQSKIPKRSKNGI